MGPRLVLFYAILRVDMAHFEHLTNAPFDIQTHDEQPLSNTT